MPESEPTAWTVPEGGYTGFPRFVWWLKRLVRRDKAVPPKPNRKQLEIIEAARAEEAKRVAAEAAEQQRQRAEQRAAEAAERERAQRELQAIATIKELVLQVDHATVIPVGSSGKAGKTSFAVRFANVVGWLTNFPIVVFDANPAEGNAYKRLGRSFGTTINVKEMFDKLDALMALPRVFLARALPNRYGVHCIAALSTVAKADNPLHDPEKVKDLIAATQKQFPIVVIDTPNVLTNEAALATVRTGSVLVPVAERENTDSLDQLYTTMQSLRVNGLEELVDMGVVSIGNLQPGESEESYRQFLSRPDPGIEGQDAEPNRDDQQFQGEMVGIPHDDALAHKGEMVIEDWDPDTRLAVFEEVIAVLKQILAYRKLHPEPTLQEPSPDDQLPVPPELAAMNGHSTTELVTTHNQGGTHA